MGEFTRVNPVTQGACVTEMLPASLLDRHRFQTGWPALFALAVMVVVSALLLILPPHTFIAASLSIAVVTILVVSQVRTEGEIRGMVRACLVGVGCVGLVALVRLISGDSLYVIDAGGIPRLQGPMGASTLAFYCTSLSLLCYSYGTMHGRRHW